MNLVHFTGPDEIFVDANILIYFALGTPEYQDACADFLTRVEEGKIHAVTSDFVLNEVLYALLVGKGSEILNSTKITKIKKHLTQDASLSADCYKVCRDFWGYLTTLQATGLRLVSVSTHEQEKSLRLGSRYLLLPTDALHVATCQRHRIHHCATADAHFEQVDLLQIWKPAKR